MSEDRVPSARGQAGPTKKGVRPYAMPSACVVLIAVVVVGVFQYTAMASFNSAVNA